MAGRALGQRKPVEVRYARFIASDHSQTKRSFPLIPKIVPKCHFRVGYTGQVGLPHR
jgi:hypothetical protein